jgi:dynein heavy chain 1, cytosolic
MNTFYAEIKKARQDLETQSIDSANTSDTIALITHVQNLKKQLKTSQDEVRQIF